MQTPTDPLVAEIVESLDEDLRDDFEERAGIVEYDGDVARPHAECLALLTVLQHHPEAIVGLTVLEMQEDGETYWVLTNDCATALKCVSERGGLPTSLRALVDNLKAQGGLIARLAPISFGIPS